MKDTPESDRRNEDDLLHRRVDHLENLLERFENTYIRSDILTERMERAKDRLDHVEKMFEEFASERTWFIRLVLGVNVVAVIGLVIQSKPS
jgi:hypothetical protein